MRKKIYITHCSAKKDKTLFNTSKKVTPDKLYTSLPLQRFIKTCKEKRTEWAIFSDKYGVIFPWDKIQWYDKHPNKVTSNEFKFLVNNFVQRLSKFEEIWFYHNPGRFHNLYKVLIRQAIKRGLIVKLFSHLSKIR
jgi:hypothetical protein